jgi:hypothetical protein
VIHGRVAVASPSRRSCSRMTSAPPEKWQPPDALTRAPGGCLRVLRGGERWVREVLNQRGRTDLKGLAAGLDQSALAADHTGHSYAILSDGGLSPVVLIRLAHGHGATPGK